MQSAVQERKQAKHATKLNERVDTEDSSQRRHSDGQTEKHEREHSRRSRRELQRVGTDSPAIQVPQQQNERNQRVYKNDEFWKRQLHGSEVLPQIHALIEMRH